MKASSFFYLVRILFLGLLLGASPAFALTAGASTLSTIIAWLQGIGVLVCTIAIMWGAFKIMFMGARINDVAPWVIGSVLFGSAAIIAGMLIGG